MKHPLCEECLKNGKVNADQLSVHHIKSPFKNGEINWELGLDDNNLRTLCETCHQKEHLKLKNNKYQTAEEIIRQLDELFEINLEDDNK